MRQAKLDALEIETFNDDVTKIIVNNPGIRRHQMLSHFRLVHAGILSKQLDHMIEQGLILVDVSNGTGPLTKLFVE